MVKVAHFKISGSAQDRMKLPGTFWTRLKTMGLTPAAVLRHSDLPPAVFSDEHLLTTSQLFAVWRSIRALGNDPSMGWKGMRNTASDRFHPALLAALNARTYRESLERFARYKQLCGAQEFRFTEDAGEFRIETIWPFAADETPPALLLDAIFALMMELGRRGTESNLAPKRVELRREQEPGSGLEEYFGCPIKYRARRDILIMRASDIDLPYVAHNEELLRMLAPQLEDQLKAEQTTPTLPAQVKWILRRLLSGSRPDVAMVAKELGMSERTLQRRITEEGTTFRVLLNDARREQVREYLADGAMEIAEVAFLLGYESQNSFYRAFRSWEGTTPAAWRSAGSRSAKKVSKP